MDPMPAAPGAEPVAFLLMLQRGMEGGAGQAKEKSGGGFTGQGWWDTLGVVGA